MNRFLLALMMLLVVGCAGNKSAGTANSGAAKPVPATTPFTAAEVGDPGPLEEMAEVADEAVDDLPDMVAAES